MPSIYSMLDRINWKNLYASNVVLSHVDYPYSKLKKPVTVEMTHYIDNNIKLYF